MVNEQQKGDSDIEKKKTPNVGIDMDDENDGHVLNSMMEMGEWWNRGHTMTNAHKWWSTISYVHPFDKIT